MTHFEDRRDNFESRFKMQQENNFKSQAKAIKSTITWVIGEFDLSDSIRQELIDSVISTSILNPIKTPKLIHEELNKLGIDIDLNILKVKLQSELEAVRKESSFHTL